MATENEANAANADPVIAWLEEIRDFEGSTDRAREMSRAAIERLAPAAAPSKSTTDTKIDRIVEESRAETERGRQARRKANT